MKGCTLRVPLDRALIAAGLCALAACASMPPNQPITYYLPKATTTFTITQTLGCNPKDKNTIVSTATVAVSPTVYAPDYDAPPQHLNMATFGKGWSDPDLDVSFTPDGRLKGINASAAGSGSQIVQGIMTLATVAVGGTAGAATPLTAQNVPAFASSAPPPPSSSDICDAIVGASGGGAQGAGAAAGGGDDKDKDKDKKAPVITLIRTATIEYSLERNNYFQARQVLPPTPTPAHADKYQCKPDLTGNAKPRFAWIWVDKKNNPNLEDSQRYYPTDPNFPTIAPVVIQAVADLNSESILERYPALEYANEPFCIQVVESKPQPYRSQWLADTGLPLGYTTLVLNGLVNATLLATGPHPNADSPVAMWRGVQTVPVANATYQIMIPNGAPFGTEKFAVALADDGSITELHYGTSGGASDVSAALQALPPALPTTANKAAELSNQSDLIYQQQRWTTCQLTPSQCTAQ